MWSVTGQIFEPKKSWGAEKDLRDGRVSAGLFAECGVAEEGLEFAEFGDYVAGGEDVVEFFLFFLNPLVLGVEGFGLELR